MRWYRRFNIAFAWENYQSCVTIEALECMFSQRKCTCEILRIVAGGVPLHVMEIVSLPPDGTPERQQAFQVHLSLSLSLFLSLSLSFHSLPLFVPSLQLYLCTYMYLLVSVTFGRHGYLLK